MTTPMTELDLIIDLQKNSERQGPGSKNDTLRALGLLNLPTSNPLKVADLGCGSGGQTITLAKNLDAHITAVDLFPEFLDELNQTSQRLGLTDRILTLEKSIDDLPFKTNTFDLIWSEGAIYNMGFENGIKKWREYLKPGGYLAVSEITWTTNTRPKEIEDFWKSEYAEIDTAANKIKQLENNGYALVGYFYLNHDSWMQTYYKPLQAMFPDFLQRNANSELARHVVKAHQLEIDLYQKYKAYYSYGFYMVIRTE